LLLVLWIVSSVASARVMGVTGAAVIDLEDVLSRYMLGIPGALLAAWGIVLEQRALRARGLPEFGRLLLYAGIAIFLYGVVGQIFTRQTAIFPSTVINSELFFELTGVPVQAMRALLAIVIAVFIIRALRVFEIEQEQMLAAARQTALTTQRDARRVTEAANRELRVALDNLTIIHRLSQALSATLDEEEILHAVFPHFIEAEQRVGAGLIMLAEPGSGEPSLKIQTECPTDPASRKMMVAVAVEIGRLVCQNDRPHLWDSEQIMMAGDELAGPAAPIWHYWSSAAAEADTRRAGVLHRSGDGPVYLPGFHPI
jgi:hypothetical protein